MVTTRSKSVEREMEGLSVVKADLSAFLHPSKTDDVQQGVLELLSSLLLRYNEEFDGVVLAYFDLKICDWTAKILNGLSPYLSLKLKAKLLLFSPKPGMLLEGKVNKVEKDYIGVIVLGIFNAAIACTDIREEFCYQENVDGIPIWASMSDNHMIRLGSKIKFSVKSVQEESFLDICGSLKPPDTGCVDWLLSPSDDKSKFMEVERKKHKKEKTREMRKEKINNEVKDSDTSNLDILYNHYHEREHNHRSKRRRNDRNAGGQFA